MWCTSKFGKAQSEQDLKVTEVYDYDEERGRRSGREPQPSVDETLS